LTSDETLPLASIDGKYHNLKQDELNAKLQAQSSKNPDQTDLKNAI
jgi:hypothetical protein